ncbi:hypothetical protein GCM10022267_69900 [Lentzea roselyniae]|uniref:Uncharacterized protein n=1 Tax=Lentzea roselyniae TaxID=531940 RepID=A0ABP7C268_9PSEU
MQLGSGPLLTLMTLRHILGGRGDLCLPDQCADEQRAPEHLLNRFVGLTTVGPHRAVVDEPFRLSVRKTDCCLDDPDAVDLAQPALPEQADHLIVSGTGREL